MINKDKKDKLEKEMQEAGIYEEDLEEQFILGSGSGGQKINKTASTVFLKHIPTGLSVRCGKDRLQSHNRFFARRMLLEKYLSEIKKEQTKKQKEIAKIRKQKQRRSKKAKEKMLEEKQKRSEIKKSRKKPSEEE
ncbi:MAG: Peptide chain release factor 2 [Chlamydiia bacterium]|nr:Peptide chain release factor 2 [Chlamydiia bacterium]